MVSMMLIISRATTPLFICKQNADSFRWRSVESPFLGAPGGVAAESLQSTAPAAGMAAGMLVVNSVLER
jgi:hypothetical protein